MTAQRTPRTLTPLRTLLFSRAADGIGEGTIAWLSDETGINRTTLSHIAGGKPANDEQKKLIAKAFQLELAEVEV